MIDHISQLPQRAAVGPWLQASKWQKVMVLLDRDEMEDLCIALGNFGIFRISGLMSHDEGLITISSFLEIYSDYVLSLQQGCMPNNEHFASYFSAIWTNDCSALYRVAINDRQQLMRVCLPVIQLQEHRFSYSAASNQFHSMVFGLDTILWGIQFSYPHLFLDERGVVYTVKEESQFSNNILFKTLQQYIRMHTMPTPFVRNGQRFNAPMRLGKKCLKWINNHPQLISKGFSVLTDFT